MDNKICKECNIEKNITEFKGKLCNMCYKTYMKNYMHDKRNSIIKDKNIKVCKKCNIEKNINEFKDKTKLCLICHKEWRKEYDKNKYKTHSIYQSKYYLLKKKYEKLEAEFEKYKEYDLFLINKSNIKKRNISTNYYINVETKICNNCHNEFNINDFYKTKYDKTGHINICKSCYIDKQDSNRKTISGYIYLIINPAWNEYVKLGRTQNINERLKQYQTQCPLKDYKIYYSKEVCDLHYIENYFKINFGNNFGEWYKIDKDVAVDIIEKLILKI
jgi:hypothetical protein